MHIFDCTAPKTIYPKTTYTPIGVPEMIVPIPFDLNRHIMLHKTVRARGETGAVINVPKEFVDQKCIVLLALYDDKEESQRWFDAVTGRAKLPGYREPGQRGPSNQNPQSYNRY